jgi:VWFA-related protein
VLFGQSPSPVTQVPTIPVEAVVLDRAGKMVDSLTPASFAVTVDGKPRRVLSLRYVSRGPGAAGDAGQRLADGASTISFAAEPARNVLVVVDEHSIQRGSERTVQQAASALIDRMGLADRVGLLRIPVPRDAQVEMTTGRPEVRDALRQIAGQATPAAGGPTELATNQPQGLSADPNRAASDPDRAAKAGRERESRPVEAQAPARTTEEAKVQPSGFLSNFLVSLNAMRELRGRKILAVFSAGFSQAEIAYVDDVARAAVAAHATIYGVALSGARDDPANPLDVGALERLAKATGGTFATLGKNADKSFERMMPELAACYVLGIEKAPADSDGSRHALRVDVPRQSVTIRAPAWFVPRRDVDDLVPLAVPAPGEIRAPAPAATASTAARAAKSGSPSKGDLEAQHLVAKAADYVAAYEREYSMLVAEETYTQNPRGGQQQQTRSDLLLVRLERVEGWVSFRDVFEVNGMAVRDRDDRLRRLFLDPTTQAQDQLKAIVAESTRYNIGRVERNINVPLFATGYLEARNLWRCQFKIAGTQDVGGVASTKVEYQEIGRPSRVQLNQTEDIFASGWFLIDPASGAITGSRLIFTFVDDSRIEFVVKYERDARLGLWVPVEMTEVMYQQPRTLNTREAYIAVDSRAAYSKFRRFQVKTDTEVKAVKK